VAFDGGKSLIGIRITQSTHAVAHNQDRFNAVVVALLLQVFEVVASLGLNPESVVGISEEGVHKFNGFDTEGFLGELGEIKVGELLSPESTVE
jgi:hypothetical protein